MAMYIVDDEERAIRYLKVGEVVLACVARSLLEDEASSKVAANIVPPCLIEAGGWVGGRVLSVLR